MPSPIRKTSLKSTFHFDNLNKLFYGIGNNTLSEDSIEYGAERFTQNISATTTWKKYWKLSYALLFDQSKTVTKGKHNSFNNHWNKWR